MAKLSIIIPSRDERFLIPTIDDIFRNARGEVEVVVVLDSDKWPDNWKSVADRHPRLVTIHNGQSIGMRGSINKGVGSAISRGAKYIAKFDGHCSFSEGFDEILKAECEPNWIVVPRRGRLDPENWVETELNKPPIDYHYLSFPDDPNDFGGPGLNGKPWLERAVERKDILLDEEMSSQGSGWFMHADYFCELQLMDEASYGPFWNEFQEIGLKCWLSGGQVMVNKKCKYLHLHKGRKYGRGYHLPESWLQQGRTHANLWAFNEAWKHQTLPFSWLIEHFWPVPTWPENWEEALYAQRKPRAIGSGVEKMVRDTGMAAGDEATTKIGDEDCELHVLSARYGALGAPIPFREHSIDVTERVRALVKNGSLDIVVNNSTLTPGDNPYRGKKKVLLLSYNYGDREAITIEREEKDWLIIGPVARDGVNSLAARSSDRYQLPTPAPIETDPVAKEFSGYSNALEPWVRANVDGPIISVEPTRTTKSYQETVMADKPTLYIPDGVNSLAPTTAPALNDYLIRKFFISPQRLRGPMPIELRDFHRNDLAQLFAELGFKHGAEIGVAEGNYSEVLLKANPECELLLVDPWGDYQDNPQGKGSNRHKFAYEETKRKTLDYKGAQMVKSTSMDLIFSRDFRRENLEGLDFCYIDGNHLFDFVMQDLIEWSKRVRSGGIVSGDDYYALDQKRWVGGGVVEAVQAYANAHRIPVWYIFQGHKSTDFMWVKP